VCVLKEKSFNTKEKKENDIEPTFWRLLNPLFVKKCKRLILIKKIILKLNYSPKTYIHVKTILTARNFFMWVRIEKKYIVCIIH
jgi:hypothetical protein